METLSLSTVLNHECAVGSAQCAVRQWVGVAAHCALPTALFVASAVEIEGDTSLFFFTEAVDD